MKINEASSVPPLRTVSLKANSSAEAPPPRNAESNVSLSPEAMSMTMSDAEARALHARVYMKPYLETQASQIYHQVGEEAFLKLPPPEHYTPEEAERFEKTLAYLAKLNKLVGLEGRPVGNPFTGMSREALVAIMEDEQNYTVIERGAADRAKSQLDGDYFSRLIRYEERSGDPRPLSKGYLEFLSHLNPAERLSFPKDEELRVAAQLMRQEQEIGPLPEGFSIWQLINMNINDDLDIAALLGPTGVQPSTAGLGNGHEN